MLTRQPYQVSRQTPQAPDYQAHYAEIAAAYGIEKTATNPQQAEKIGRAWCQAEAAIWTLSPCKLTTLPYALTIIQDTITGKLTPDQAHKIGHLVNAGLQ